MRRSTLQIPVFQVFIGAMLGILMSQCASKQESEQAYSDITLSNTGSYAMHSPLACYYGDNDPQHCVVIDESIEAINPGNSHTFKIKANQRIRLVFPFDAIQRSAGIVYRPNCHILLDFFAFKEKRYYANAEIRSPRSAPEKGFNCDVKVFEQGMDTSTKTEMTEVLSKIRYRVPRQGETREGYISNYHWQ